VRSLLGELTPCEGTGLVAALSLKKDWFLRKEVKRWTMKDFVDVEVVGAVDAVTASTASGAAGVVYASAVAAAAVDRCHEIEKVPLVAGPSYRILSHHLLTVSPFAPRRVRPSTWRSRAR
jgi:hypothetical protein